MFFSKLPVFLSRFRRLVPQIRTCYCSPPIICDPPPRPMTVTVIGATCPVGKMLALLLKQNTEIDMLRLYDVCQGTCGIAMDLSHIDTNTNVLAYTGSDMLVDAISDAQIVICCCGQQKRPAESEDDLFDKNADDVRCLGMHMAEFNPKGVLCIATPPVNALVPMVSQEYKKALVYDYRKIIGITAISYVRANSIAGAYVKCDPSDVTCPVIGGLSPYTTVAVLSQCRPKSIDGAGASVPLRKKIAFAEETVLAKKHEESAGSLSASPAFAICRFVTSLAQSLKGERGCAECAYVRQIGHIGTFLPYMATIVKLGVHGLESCHMPKINESECKQLHEAAEHIRRSVSLGECYITGEFPNVPKRCPHKADSCMLVTKNKPRLIDQKQQDKYKEVCKKCSQSRSVSKTQ